MNVFSIFAQRDYSIDKQPGILVYGDEQTRIMDKYDVKIILVIVFRKQTSCLSLAKLSCFYLIN